MYVHLLHLRLETFLPSVQIKRSRPLRSKIDADRFEINVSFIGRIFLRSRLFLNDSLISILIPDKKRIKIQIKDLDNRNKEIFVRSTFDFNNFIITDLEIRTNILIHASIITLLTVVEVLMKLIAN